MGINQPQTNQPMAFDLSWMDKSFAKLRNRNSNTGTIILPFMNKVLLKEVRLGQSPGNRLKSLRYFSKAIIIRFALQIDLTE